MPRTDTLSGRTMLEPVFMSPRPRMVCLCFSGRLMPLRTSVTRSFFAMVSFPFPLLADLGERLAAQPGGVLAAAELLKRVDGGVNHVVRVGGPDALREDVLDTRDLEDVAHGAARDDARTGARRPQQHGARAEVP